MVGFNAQTGRLLSDFDHVHQSVAKILNTRVGTRVLRRRYGSDVPNLVDRPADEEMQVDLYIAVAEAIAEWEPRIKINEISVRVVGVGKVELRLAAIYLADGRPVQLEGLIVR